MGWPSSRRGSRQMATVIVGMTSSLDGFVADPSGGLDRLYPDLEALQGSAYMNSLIEETGAVLMGRRAFEMGDPDWFVGNYEFQVPIFVLTHHPPDVQPKQDERLTFTFVTDGIEQLLRAGLADELRVDFMPVLLGAGLRPFGGS